MLYKFILTFFLLCNLFLVFSQETTLIYGKITDGSGNIVFMANISVEGVLTGTISDKNGLYELRLPANTDLIIIYSCIGFETIRYLFRGSSGLRTQLDQVMAVSYKTLQE